MNGFMPVQVNVAFGKRWTPAHSFRHRYKQPLNVLIQTNTFVQKVLMKSSFEAYGVEYLYLGEKLKVYARKAVVLSAGVVGTPKLLMLSGIGPKQHLKEMGIKTKINLPVGSNLHDHVTTGLDLVLLNTTLDINPATMLSPVSVLNYIFRSSGPWTGVGCEVVGMVNSDNDTYCRDNAKHAEQRKITSTKRYKLRSNTTSKKSKSRIDLYLPKAKRFISRKIVTETDFKVKRKTCSGTEGQPDLGFMVLPVGASVDGGKHIQKALGLNDRTWSDYFAPLVDQSVISILPIVLHPRSKGTMRLLNKNPSSPPLIDPNYLSDPQDIEVLLKGISIIKEIITTEPMQKLGAKLNTRKFPGCESYDFDTPPYWRCYVTHLTITSYHPVGTCKMGNVTDELAVVDYNFRVHGTNKLFVADASVIPSTPSGNPNAAVAMMGEKAADEIKNYQFLNTKTCSKREVFFRRRTCRIYRKR